MTSWSLVECGFDGADETINFGSRIYAEGSLFESVTLATISTNEKQEKNPNIISLNLGKKLYIVIDNSFRIFSESCSNLDLFVSFDSLIDSFCVTEDEKFVLLCLCDGNVHCQYACDGAKLICSVLISDDIVDDKCFVSTYVESYYDNYVNFILITKSGKVFRLTIKGLNTLNNVNEEAHIDHSVQTLCSYEKNILVTQFNSSNGTVILSGNKFGVYNTNNESVYNSRKFNSKLSTLYDTGTPFYLGLDANGSIVGVCPITLMLFTLWEEENIADFVLIQNVEFSTYHLLILTKPDEHENSFIKLVSYPDFEIIYQLKVSRSIFLVHLGSNQDEIMFIEGIQNVYSNIIDELRLKVIMESDPEIRLNKILQRKQFVEAEKFAKDHNLDLEIVWKAKAGSYIDKLRCSKSELEELLEVLDKIKDIRFIVQCCSDITTDSIESVYRMFEYTSNKLQTAIINNSKDLWLCELQDNVVNNLNRLDTFLILYTNDCSNLVEKWNRFSSIDLFEEMQRYLQNCQISESAYIFNRLDYRTKSELTIKKIEHMLNLIPSKITLMNLLPWLRHFFPTVLTIIPESLSTFIEWLHNNIIKCETTNENDWPDYALHFAEEVLNLLHINMDSEDVSLLFQQQCSINKNALTKISNLISALREVQCLKHDFKIKISLQSFMEPPKTVVWNLLNQIHLDQMKSFVGSFLLKYMLNHNLDSDKILSEYIEELTYSQMYWWQETAIILLQFIHSLTKKMENTLLVLKSSDVPWSSQIEQLAQDSMKQVHPLADKIRLQQQNICVKILLKNYEIHKFEIFDEDQLLTIIRRIMYVSLPKMFEDIEVVASRNSSIEKEYKLSCLNYFISHGRFKEALKFLDGMNEENIAICCNSIFNITREMLSIKRDYGCLNNYIEILSSILCRLYKHSDNWKHKYLDADYKQLKNLYILKNEYNYHDYIYAKEEKSVHFSQLMTNIKQSLDSNEISLVEACFNCERIVKIFELNTGDGVLKLIDKNECLPDLIAAAEYLLNICGSSENMCSMAVCLIKNMCYSKPVDIDNIFNTEQDKSLNLTNMKIICESGSEESLNVVKGLELIHELALQAFEKADVLNIHVACEILNWSSSYHYLRHKPETKWKHSSVYESDPVFPPSLFVAGIVKDIFGMYLQLTGAGFLVPNEVKFTEMKTELNKALLISNSDYLKMKIKQLHTEGHDLTAFNLLHTLKTSLNILKLQPELLIVMKKNINSILISQCIPQLLHKIITAKNVDENFAVMLLKNLDQQAIRWISSALKMFKTDVNKLKAVASLSLRYLATCGIKNEFYNACFNIQLRCVWWKKCFHSLVTYRDAFEVQPEKLLKELISSELFTLKLLQEFCIDFKLNIQLYLPAYLRNILLNWQPIFEVVNSTGMRKMLVVKNSESELFQKCEEVINLINNKNVVITELSNVWNEISYYKYEVYICIIDLFEKLDCKIDNSNKKFLLLFLQRYTRINKPHQREIEDWQSIFPFTSGLDELSEYRLPYLPALFTKDVWKILRSEMNLSTYEQWFQASTLLNLDKNDICVYAIKGAISEGMLNSNENEWNVHSRHDSLLKSMEKCASNMTNLEMATAVLYQVVYKMSGGADQVIVARMCWKKVQMWVRSECDSENLQKVYDKVQRKYFNCSTMHILYLHNLGDKRYLQCIDQIDQLIKLLYRDERLIQSSKSIVLHRPDINKAVDELAQLHNIDIEKLRISLIMQLLQETPNVVNLDDTFMNPNTFIENDCPSNSHSNDNLKRICYICESGDKNFWLSELKEIGIIKEAELNTTLADDCSISLPMRVRALQCLLAISDTNMIEEITGKTNNDFNTYLNNLDILSQLELLGVSLSMDDLYQCEKSDLVCKLMQAHAHNPLAISTMAKLCAHYKLWQLKFWEAIIVNFIRLKMVKELREWLPKLTKYSHIMCGTAYRMAWNYIIEAPLNNVSAKSNEECENMCINSILLLQTCPIMSKINLLNISQKFIKLKKFEYSAIMLPYAKTDQREQIMKSILTCNTIDMKKIEDLSKHGVLNTKQAMEILTSSLNYD